MKRYSVEFDFTPNDQLEPEERKLYGKCWDYTKQCYCETHEAWGTGASTLKTAKSYINRIKRRYPSQNPHNFRIFDTEAPLEPCGHSGQVFFQA